MIAQPPYVPDSLEKVLRTSARRKLSEGAVIHLANNSSYSDLYLPIHVIKKHTAPMAWLLIGALFLIPIGGHAIDGLLLCVEADGHVEVESSAELHHNSFHDPQISPVQSESALVMARSGIDLHSVECLDILLARVGDTDCGALETKPISTPQLIGFTPISGCEIQLLPVTTRTSLRDSTSPIIAANLAELRTVRLLI